MWPQGHIRVTFVSQGGLHQWTVWYGALWRGPQVCSVGGWSSRPRVWQGEQLEGAGGLTPVGAPSSVRRGR